jgi:hypothetical protein
MDATAAAESRAGLAAGTGQTSTREYRRATTVANKMKKTSPRAKI